MRTNQFGMIKLAPDDPSLSGFNTVTVSERSQATPNLLRYHIGSCRLVSVWLAVIFASLLAKSEICLLTF